MIYPIINLRTVFQVNSGCLELFINRLQKYFDRTAIGFLPLENQGDICTISWSLQEVQTVRFRHKKKTAEIVWQFSKSLHEYLSNWMYASRVAHDQNEKNSSDLTFLPCLIYTSIFHKEPLARRFQAPIIEVEPLFTAPPYMFQAFCDFLQLDGCVSAESHQPVHLQLLKWVQ